MAGSSPAMTAEGGVALGTVGRTYRAALAPRNPLALLGGGEVERRDDLGDFLIG
jgi:hypothetical protein